MSSSSSSVGFMLALVLACTPAQEESSSAAAAEKVTPERVLEPKPEPELEPKPEPEPKPSFDPATVTSIRVEILELYNRDSWVACGIHHSVGVIRVAVLGVGEPPPEMLLFISCPADSGARRSLEVGTKAQVTLHARKQTWPIPSWPLPAELPRRYVESISGLGVAGLVGESG